MPRGRVSMLVRVSLCWLTIGVLASFLAVPQRTSAGQSTPIDATLTCSTTARPVEDLLALLAPLPGNGTPWPGHAILPLPTGEPADPALVAEISLMLRNLEACASAGIDLRFFEFFSDAWISRMIARDELVAELRAMAAATPTPIPAGQRVLFPGPWHVEVLDDGRVLAATLWAISEDAPYLALDRTKALVFVWDSGRWVIDEIIESVDGLRDVEGVVGPPPDPVLALFPAPCPEEHASRRHHGSNAAILPPAPDV